MDLIEKVEYIAEHYGYEKQSRQTQEECAELIQAINKLARSKEEGIEAEVKALKSVIEEMADVKIMVNQLAHLLHAEADVTIAAEKKIERQIARIEDQNRAGEKVKVYQCANCGAKLITNIIRDGISCRVCKGGPLVLKEQIHIDKER